jgi:DNA-binding transcriptional MerR regulator
MNTQDLPDIMTPAEVAAFFRVDPKTVARWDNDGTLKAAFRTPSGHRRYVRAEVEALRQCRDNRDEVDARAVLALIHGLVDARRAVLFHGVAEGDDGYLVTVGEPREDVTTFSEGWVGSTPAEALRNAHEEAQR